MRSRTTILAVAPILALTAAPTLAMTHHHHRMHHRQLHESTPAERQQTADLNRQQLAGMGNPSAMQQNTLQTQPASYQRGTGVSGTATETSPSSSSETPDAAMPQSNSSETMSPPPANPSGTPQ